MCRQYLFRLERSGVSIASSACYRPQGIKLSDRAVVHDRRCWAGTITLRSIVYSQFTLSILANYQNYKNAL